MPRLKNSYRHLKPEDSMTIASLMQQNYSQRDIAQLPNCSVAQPVPSAVNWGATPKARPTTAKVHIVPASIAA
jgi:hypothetical protein